MAVLDFQTYVTLLGGVNPNQGFFKLGKNVAVVIAPLQIEASEKKGANGLRLGDVAEF
jgi:hypothetical protein